MAGRSEQEIIRREKLAKLRAMGQKSTGHTYWGNTRDQRLQSTTTKKRETMHRLLARCLLLLFFVHASSCSVTKTVRSTKTNTASSPKVVKPTPPKTPVKALPLTTNEKVANYLQRFGSIAQAEMKQYKIPASITLAQGLLESGFGEGRLAVQANNHFGIKCHSTWQGKRIYHDDDEKGEWSR